MIYLLRVTCIPLIIKLKNLVNEGSKSSCKIFTRVLFNRKKIWLKQTSSSEESESEELSESSSLELSSELESFADSLALLASIASCAVAAAAFVDLAAVAELETWRACFSSLTLCKFQPYFFFINEKRSI